MKKYLSNILIAASTALVIVMLLPLQTYLGNSSMYVFPLWQLMLEELAFSALVAAALFLVLRFLNFGGYFGSLLVALLICVYLESGFLSAGIPAIQGGNIPELSNFTRGMLDATIWAIIIVGFLIMTHKLRPFLHFIALAILILSMVALFDVRRDTEGVAAGRLEGKSGLAILPEIVKNVEYSPTRNVLMFVMDNVPSVGSEKILRGNPELATHFTGFTFYSDNIGMHNSTKRGVPALMTGEYFESGCNKNERLMSVLSPRSFLRAFQDHGDSIFCTLEVLAYGFTTAKTSAELPKPKHRYIPAVMMPANEVPYLSIVDVVAFRLMPFLGKGKFLFQRIRGNRMFDEEISRWQYEQVMYPELARRPVSADSRQMFGKFHSNGTHPPYRYGKNEDEVLQKCLSEAAKLVDALKEKGIYDKSLIIFTTDHGSGLDKKQRARALLWIKPEGAVGPNQFSQLSTSHSKLATLMRTAAVKTLTKEEIEHILETSNRLYRYVDDAGQVFDYRF